MVWGLLLGQKLYQKVVLKVLLKVVTKLCQRLLQKLYQYCGVIFCSGKVVSEYCRKKFWIKFGGYVLTWYMFMLGFFGWRVLWG